MRAPGFSHSGTVSISSEKRRWIRLFCIAVVLVEIPIGVGFFRQSTWATDLWPLPDVRMTYIFFASIIATTATLFAWAAWRDEPGTLPAIGVVAATATPTIGAYLTWLGLDRGEGHLTAAGITTIALGAATVAFTRWVGRAPIADPRPLPRLIRWSFVGFCAILIPVGIALTFQVEDAFPWNVSPENSTVIGLIFLSAAALFAWIIRHPRWAYGEMALTSFLVYDLVLFGPYLDLMRNRNDTATVASYYGGDPSYAAATDNGINEMGLTVYLAVLAISAIVAIGFYLWGLRPRPVEQVAPAQ